MITSTTSKMYETRSQRLNALAKINSAARYLEVGVSKGITFNQVDIPFKVAVDPKFRFKVQDYASQNTIFHEVTSDLFFSKLAPIYGEYDLIYLDGLHTFEQTFRDFCASLCYAHARTIWLIDDTHPTGRLAAIPDHQFVKRSRKVLRIKDARWMGDVFKAVFAIHDFFPQFSYATFPEHGQTAIWLETRENFLPTWNSLEKISRLSYGDFLKFRDSHLSIMPPSQILETIEKKIRGSIS
jgi:hypothetical protein